MALHSRYLFVDLDSLLASVKLQVQVQPFEFSVQQRAMSMDELAVDPQKLTEMLTDAASIVSCRKGSFYQPQAATGNALRAIGWDMKKKGTMNHRTLENLLEQTFKEAGACLRFESKTLVLATGDIAPSILSALEVFLQGNWRVQLYFLQRCQQLSSEQLLREFPDKLELIYIDHYVQSLLVSEKELAVEPPAAVAVAATRVTLTSLSARSAPDPHQARQQQPSGPRTHAATGRPSSASSSRGAPAAGVQLGTVYRGPGAQQLARGFASAAASRGAPKPFQKQKQQVRAADPAAVVKEQALVAKRRGMLHEILSTYTPDDRQRFVFMDFDNVTAGLFSHHHHLYTRVSGAKSAHDLFLNLEALTSRICGDNPAVVQRQLATYYNSREPVSQKLKDFRWEVAKQETVSDTSLQLQLFAQCQHAAVDTKTLVLVTGDGNIAANNRSFKEIVHRYLQHGWFVEIHAWLHSLSESYIEFQKTYPNHVIVKPLDDIFDQLVLLKGNYPVSTASRNVAGTAAPTPAMSSDELTQLQLKFQEMEDAMLAIQIYEAERESTGLLPQIEAKTSSVDHAEVEAQIPPNGEAAAVDAQTLALREDWEYLVCPLTHELFERPVTVSCCAKAFSEHALLQLRRQDPRCPWCHSSAYTMALDHYLAKVVGQIKQ